MLCRREQAVDPHESEQVAREATALLAARPVEEIVAAQQALWDLMGESYTNPRLDPAWAFDFDDSDEMARRLPRLAALYTD
ncbi:hypothetical protein [Streptomyces sp. NPDC093223]|uniref:hypothetical protein n=1 Tax=Streptomyces sp. NPDC093223 TaxID=3366033 RepID=UPI0037FDBFA2